VDVNTDDLSAFLNLAWQNASEAANSLSEQLLAEQQKALALIASGSVSSVGKNSANQSYGQYGPGNLTQRQITNIFTTLIRYYQVIKDKIACLAAHVVPPVDMSGYDYDPTIFSLLTQFFQVSTQAARLPDIADLRIPFGRFAGGYGGGFCGPCN